MRKSPAKYAYVERYNRTVRHEWLDQTAFANIEEVQDHATQWLWTYTNDRPNMGLGGITPAQKLKRKPPREFYDRIPLKMGGLPGPALAREKRDYSETIPLKAHAK